MEGGTGRGAMGGGKGKEGQEGGDGGVRIDKQSPKKNT